MRLLAGGGLPYVLDGIREGWLGTRRPVVFIHTGGIFSDFAWPDLLMGGVSE